MPKLLWVAFTEDGDVDTFVRATTEQEARAAATDAGCEDFTIRRVTADELRDMRNAERQETRPRRAKPVSTEARAWHARIGMGAAMALFDPDGKCRCPQCRRFATLDDFTDAPVAASGGGMASSSD